MSKSIGPVVVMAAVIGVAAAIAQGVTQRAEPEATAPANVSHSVQDGVPDWVPPHRASATDIAIMRTYAAKQELCRGSPDEATTNQECPLFSDAAQKLAARGWCFDYPDKPASEGAWHRCPKDAPDEAASAIDPLFIDFSRWMQETPNAVLNEKPDRRRELVETWRTASPELKRYQSLVQPYDVEHANANALHFYCGLRTDQWFYSFDRRLRTQSQNDPELATLRTRFTKDEMEALNAYETFLMYAQLRFMLGTDTAQGCAHIAGMPFIARYDAYERGELASLH